MKKTASLILVLLLVTSAFAQTDITKLACAMGKHYTDPAVWEAIEMTGAYNVKTKQDFFNFIANSGNSAKYSNSVSNIEAEIEKGYLFRIKFPVTAQTQLPEFLKADRSYKTTLSKYPAYSRYQLKDCNIRKGENCWLGLITENTEIPFTAYYSTVTKNDVLLSALYFGKPDKPLNFCTAAVAANEPVSCLLGRKLDDPATIELMSKHGIATQLEWDTKEKKNKIVLVNSSDKVKVFEHKGTITQMIVYDLNLVPEEIRKFASKKELFNTLGYLPNGESKNEYIFNTAGEKFVTSVSNEENILNLSLYNKVRLYETLTWKDFETRTSKGKCISGNCINGKGKYFTNEGKFIITTFKNGIPVGTGVIYRDEYDYQLAKWDENGSLIKNAIITEKYCMEGDCENGNGASLSGNVYYNGEFKNGLYHGEGYMIDYANFRRISGTFENGKKHGWVMTAERDGKKLDYRQYIQGQPQKTSEELAEEQRKKQAEELKKLAAEEREKRSLELEIEEAVKIKKLKESNPVLHFKCESGNCQNGFGKASNATEGYTYEGSFKEGVYHGVGTMIWKNGDIYIGEFSYGIGHGNGYFRHGNESYDGPFEYGQATCKTCWKGNNDANVKYNSSNQWLLESIERQQSERDRWDAWQNAPTFEQYMEQRKYNVND